MKTGKFWALLSTLIVLALLVSGCGGGQTQATPIIQTVEVEKEVTTVVEVEKEVTTVVEKEVQVEVTAAPEAVAEPGEDEIVTINWWGTERGRDTAATRELHFTLARAFEESHPNTKVAVSLFPSRGFNDRVLTAIAAGQGPDVWYGTFAPDIAVQGFLEDLTPYMEESGIDPAERWFPIGQQRAVYNDRYYGVPRDATAGFIAYNKDLFDAAGVEYPEEGWTIADFREKAVQLTDASQDRYGVGAIVGSTGCFQWSSFSFNAGADFVSPDGRQVAGYMDTPEAINAIKYCLDLTAEDQVTAPPGMQEQFGELVFISGQVAMEHVSTWELPALREATFNWDVVGPPRFDEDSEGIAWTDSYVYYVWSGSPRKQRAWEFVEWLSGPEAAALQAEIWTPANPEAWEELGWPDDPILSVAWEELNKETRVPNYLRSQFYFDCVGPVFDNLWTRYIESGERELEAMVQEEVAAAQTCLDDRYSGLEQ